MQKEKGKRKNKKTDYDRNSEPLNDERFAYALHICRTYSNEVAKGFAAGIKTVNRIQKIFIKLISYMKTMNISPFQNKYV